MFDKDSSDITADDLRAALAERGADAVARQLRAVPLPTLPLAALAADPEDRQARRFLALYPGTPSRVVSQLAAEDGDPALLALLAGHPRASSELLLHLAREGAVDVRLAAAANKALTPQAAALLAMDPCPAVRCALAENPTLFPRVQRMLANDPEPMVQAALATARTLNAKTFDALVASECHASAKLAACALAEMDEDLATAAADTDDPEWQDCLLMRPDLPAEALASLCFSPHEAIALAAIRRKELAEDELLGWSVEGSPEIRRAVAAKPDISFDTQSLLAGDADAGVRAALAANACLDPDTALILADDPAEEVLAELALNPATPPEVVAKLCSGPSPAGRQAAALRPDLPAACAETLLNERKDADAAYILALSGRPLPPPGAEMTRVLAKSDAPTLRILAAGSPALDPMDVPRLAFDPCDGVRLRLAANPAVPTEQLSMLIEDKCPAVAEAAAANLAARGAPRPPPPGGHGDEDADRLVGSLVDGLAKLRGWK